MAHGPPPLLGGSLADDGDPGGQTVVLQRQTPPQGLPLLSAPTAVKPLGEELPAPARRSATSTVPAVVPSLVQSSAPVAASDARAAVTAVRSAACARWMFSTISAISGVDGTRSGAVARAA